MADEAAESGSSAAHRDVKAELDERRVARGVALGLPVVTVAVALLAALTQGAPMAILVLAAGVLLGVIALFWASLRILSGDAALPPELEALDATAHAVDGLASRKKMLVRALKDLDNERALGKLDDEDHEQLSHTYRGELKDVMSRIDASLAPHRAKAEEAARAYLAKAGAAGAPAPTAATASEPEPTAEAESGDEAEARPEIAARIACAKCAVSNEPDATFCKKCGASLSSDNATKEAEARDEA
jgi:hypothetical protein